ncbi:MAG TPA: Pvc16 family protein [Gemmatimonadaceae bacterium]|jgi:hypothetical protein|nr:Pvc16 family protein [Gemmatimonadaceae bacterium]
MLTALHVSLRTLLYDRGLIDRADVDIAFDAPAKAWISARMRPTINFFLYDVEENTDLRNTGMQTARANGVGIHRMPPRRFDLRFMVSAITTVIEDEHLLLWRALVTLMKHPTLPAELVPEPARVYDVPVVTKVTKPNDSPRVLDVWGALEAPPRPALLYTVTLPVDLEVALQAPLVLTRTTRYRRAHGAEAAEAGVAVGGVVRDAAGRPLTGARVIVDGRAFETTTGSEGEFVLPDVNGGPVTLRVAREGRPEKRVTFDIPSDRYEIVVD